MPGERKVVDVVKPAVQAAVAAATQAFLAGVGLDTEEHVEAALAALPAQTGGLNPGKRRNTLRNAVNAPCITIKPVNLAAWTSSGGAEGAFAKDRCFKWANARLLSLALAGLHSDAPLGAELVAVRVAAQLQSRMVQAPLDRVVVAVGSATVCMRVSASALDGAFPERAGHSVAARPTAAPHVPYTVPGGDKHLRGDDHYLNFLRLGRAIVETRNALAVLVDEVGRRHHERSLLPAAKASPELDGVHSVQCPLHTGSPRWDGFKEQAALCAFCTPWLTILPQDHVTGDGSNLHTDNSSPSLLAHPILGPFAVLKVCVLTVCLSPIPRLICRSHSFSVVVCTWLHGCMPPQVRAFDRQRCCYCGLPWQSRPPGAGVHCVEAQGVRIVPPEQQRADETRYHSSQRSGAQRRPATAHRSATCTHGEPHADVAAHCRLV